MTVGMLTGITVVADMLGRRRKLLRSPRSSTTDNNNEKKRSETPSTYTTLRPTPTTSDVPSSLQKEYKSTKASYVFDNVLSGVSDTTTTVAKRKIELRKFPNKEFGASLANVAGGHLVVVMIHKYVTKHGRRVLSSAFTQGLRVGDEITFVNGNDLYLSCAEQCETFLFKESNVVIKVNEQPGVRTFTLPIPDITRSSLVSSGLEGIFGFSYKNGAISSLKSGTLAHSVGLYNGLAIISVNGKSVLGLSENEVLCEIQHALCGDGDEVAIQTLNAGVATAIAEGARSVMDVIAPSVSVSEAVNKDFEFESVPLPKRKIYI